MGMWTIPENENNSSFTDEELVEFASKLAEGIVKRNLSVPAVMALEMARPLSYVGYASLVMLAPALEIIFDPTKIEKVQAIFNDRKKVEGLIEKIEALEATKNNKTSEIKEDTKKGTNQ